jgi:crotonobetainyl-CoA:carnitine CoA-transferase CaiB-like acyl-CoA transferase
VLAHPQIQASGLVGEQDHPSGGRLRQPRPAARFDRTPAAPGRPAPALGQHTDEILAELGLDAGEIQALRREAVVA